MDGQAFAQAAARAADEVADGGIGTRNESPLHAALKLYFEPRRTFHEVPVDGYIVDIKNETGIIEIQTRNFLKLRRKLGALLERHTVTLVYPVAAVKWVLWIDPDTGEITNRRKSPKRCLPAAAFEELGYIQALLFHPNLRIRIAMLELEEYKYLNGYGESRKCRATRAVRIPLGLLDEISVDAPAQFTQLVPPGLPSCFTAEEFRKAAGINLSAAQAALRILCAAGLAIHTGKQGRRYAYALTGPSADWPVSDQCVIRPSERVSR